MPSKNRVKPTFFATSLGLAPLLPVYRPGLPSQESVLGGVLRRWRTLALHLLRMTVFLAVAPFVRWRRLVLRLRQRACFAYAGHLTRTIMEPELRGKRPHTQVKVKTGSSSAPRRQVRNPHLPTSISKLKKAELQQQCVRFGLLYDADDTVESLRQRLYDLPPEAAPQEDARSQASSETTTSWSVVSGTSSRTRRAREESQPVAMDTITEEHMRMAEMLGALQPEERAQIVAAAMRSSEQALTPDMVLAQAAVDTAVDSDLDV